MPSGIVDEAINPAVAGDGSLYQILYVLGFSDVAVNKESLARTLGLRHDLQSASRGSPFLFIIATDDNLSASSDKLLGTAFADAAAAARNNHYSICISQVCHL